MALFGLGKKKPAFSPRDDISSIKVLGTGCKTCHQQYEYVTAAAKTLALDAAVEYITDMEHVVSYGVMTMPAIVINETVVSAGKLLSEKDVIRLLSK